MEHGAALEDIKHIDNMEPSVEECRHYDPRSRLWSLLRVNIDTKGQET